MNMQTAIKGLAVAAGLALASMASPASAAFVVKMNSATMDYTYQATIAGHGTAVANGINFNVTNTTGSAVGQTYDLFAFCIDVFHNINPGAVNGDYYLSTYGDEPNPPLYDGSPGPGVLDAAERRAITTLADIGFILNRDKTLATAADVSRRTAAIQAAIWSLEGHTVTLVNGGNAATAGTYANYFNTYRAIGLAATDEARIFTLTDTTYDPPGPGNDTEANHQGFIVGWPPEGGVPEPATWAMMIMGFGAAGVVLRRRRQAVEA